MPGKDAQLAPTDGYGIKEGIGRGIVNTHIETRTPGSPGATQAVAEGLKLQAEQRNRRDAALARMREEEKAKSEEADAREESEARAQAIAGEAIAQNESRLTETILRMQLDQSNELREAEQRHRDKVDEIRMRYDQERQSLLRIIEQQSKEIARLSSVAPVRAYGNIQGDNGFIGVAESVPGEDR